MQASMTMQRLTLKIYDSELAKDILTRIEDDWKNLAKDSLPDKP
jgi:hypothetical protein